jgi:hypothetical protein
VIGVCIERQRYVETGDRHSSSAPLYMSGWGRNNVAGLMNDISNDPSVVVISCMYIVTGYLRTGSPLNFRFKFREYLLSFRLVRFTVLCPK